MSVPEEEIVAGAADQQSVAHKQEKEAYKQAIERAKAAYKEAEKRAKQAYEEAVEAEKRAEVQRHRAHKEQERAEKERRQIAKQLRKPGNATGTWTHHGNNSSHQLVNATLDQVIEFPVGGSLSLEALPQPAQIDSSLSTVGGVAIVAAVGFVAFKIVKKYGRRANYHPIPSETTPLI
ncbi:hypothetical protein H310_00134 [Aphanomyces invadans]|uniref:Uncharacterized protein n=1 Tax=Aphanomyces invadans TaxID=157072 RepID=A0A024UTC1_9STRA|nr:hypothetical protein H310_00134 [Aphanomyces invadans]ETW09594.1 hypothetical protein H310_00134 [Aphanomyces invadans]|eukprot:XP_008861005.1 hypothetical protein H310_00134 [Aphanomyces invadans]